MATRRSHKRNMELQFSKTQKITLFKAVMEERKLPILGFDNIMCFSYIFITVSGATFMYLFF